MRIMTGIMTAFLVAQESKCPSYKVGAVIEHNGSIISMGVNGTASGTINPDEMAIKNSWGKYNKNGKIGLLVDKKQLYSIWATDHVIHAEQNAILFAAKNGRSINNSTMYCTMSPCTQCAKLIAQSGIKTLVYCEEYGRSNESWKSFLDEAGVKVIHIPKESMNLLNFENIITKIDRIDD